MMMTTRIAELLLLTVSITVKLTASAVTLDVITVDNVAVQQGKSIIIPCLYDAKYINNRKYLCVGNTWFFCKDVQEINQRTTISDDQAQHIFTVNMKNVTTSDHYWCAVHILGWGVKKMFQLTVTKATPELYVDNQMVTGYEGSHVVIFCHHQMKKQKKWCKLGGRCVSTTGDMSGASVQLSSMAGGFSVTMSELTMNHTGWYWCSAGDKQMPVHITVKTRATTWERRSLAWLVVLGLLFALACLAMIVFQQKKKQREAFPLRKGSENSYVSMNKPKTNQHENEESEAQEYELMSSPEQTAEDVVCKVQGGNSEASESAKTEKGHHIQQYGLGFKEPYYTC